MGGGGGLNSSHIDPRSPIKIVRIWDEINHDLLNSVCQRLLRSHIVNWPMDNGSLQ